MAPDIDDGFIFDSNLYIFHYDWIPKDSLEGSITMVNILKDNLKKLRSLKSTKTAIPKMKPSFDTKRIQTVLQTFEDTSEVAFQLFDSDSDTTIVDTSANCIVWKHRKDFIDATYMEIPQDLGITVNTIHIEGIPIGVGTIRVR